MNISDEEQKPSEQPPQDENNGVEDIEGTIAYLDELTAREKAIEEDPSAGSTIPMDESLAAEDLPTWVIEPPSDTQDDDDVTLSWLENISQKSPSEEQATQHLPADQMLPAQENSPSTPVNEPSDIDDSEADPVKSVEDNMDWLDELAANRGTPLEEMQTVVISPEDQYQVGKPETAKEDESDTPDGSVANHSEDPMAWLEQLAADQNTPLEDLPSVAARLLASEIISQVDEEGSIMLPIAQEEALYYLEQKAAEEGITLNEVTVPEKSDIVNMNYAFEQVDQLAAGRTNALAGLVFAKAQAVNNEPLQTIQDLAEENDVSSRGDLPSEMPDDPDEVLTWLEGLANDPEALAAATAVAAADTNPPEVVPSVEETVVVSTRDEKALPVEDTTLDEMPEDPDEAMEWLNKVAAEQSAEKGAPEKSDEPATEIISSAAVESASNNAAQFTTVNQALEDGNIEQAAAIYHEILQQDDMLPEAVASLETAVTQNPESGQLRHLLGDAYMRQGQMQKALEVYRQGFLDHL